MCESVWGKKGGARKKEEGGNKWPVKPVAKRSKKSISNFAGKHPSECFSPNEAASEQVAYLLPDGGGGRVCGILALPLGD